MDRSAVEAVAAAALPLLVARLGLERWELGVSCLAEPAEPSGRQPQGHCTRMADYQSAHITLNHEAVGGTDEVLATLRHELFHVILAPFDLFRESVALANPPADVAAILDRIWQHAEESAVANLERMYAGLDAARAAAAAGPVDPVPPPLTLTLTRPDQDQSCPPRM